MTRPRIRPVPVALERASGWSWRLLTCALLLAAVIALLWYLRVIVLPIIVALTISPALMPLVRLLRRRLPVSRAAAAVSLIIALLVIAGLVALITTSVVQEYDELSRSVEQGVDDVIAWLEGEPFNLSLERVSDFNDSLGTAWRQASDYLVAGLSTGVGLLTGIILAIALLYFILRDGPELWQWFLRRFSAENRVAIDQAGQRSWKVLGGYIRGTALIALIDAVLIGIGIWLLGVPLAFPLAVLIFLGGFVPFVGATISGLVAVLVAFADQGWEIALVTLGIVLGVQFLEGNFLQPIIQSRTVDLHPAIVLLAVAAGGSLFGIIGAYLAVPVTAVAFAAIAAFQAPEPATAGAGP